MKKSLFLDVINEPRLPNWIKIQKMRYNLKKTLTFKLVTLFLLIPSNMTITKEEESWEESRRYRKRAWGRNQHRNVVKWKFIVTRRHPRMIFISFRSLHNLPHTLDDDNIKKLEGRDREEWKIMYNIILAARHSLI